MLTKDDLKAIKKVIREEIEAEGRNIRDELKSEMFDTKFRILKEVNDLSDRIKNLEIRVNSLESSNKKEFKRLDKKFTDLFDFLDKYHLANLRRIERIETHLNFPIPA